MNKRPVVRYICTITCRADDQVYDVVADLDNREIMIQVFQHIKKKCCTFFHYYVNTWFWHHQRKKGVYFIHKFPLCLNCVVKHNIFLKILDKTCTIQIQQPISPEDPDNRFFIFYELDDENNVYELFLYASMNLSNAWNKPFFSFNNSSLIYLILNLYIIFVLCRSVCEV